VPIPSLIRRLKGSLRASIRSPSSVTKQGSRNHLPRASSENSQNTVSASPKPALLLLARIPAVYSILESEPRPAGRYVRAELEEGAAARRPLQAAMRLSRTGPTCPHPKQRTLLRPPPTTSTSLGCSSCSHQVAGFALRTKAFLLLHGPPPTHPPQGVHLLRNPRLVKSPTSSLVNENVPN
jgi:hypothetical protein